MAFLHENNPDFSFVSVMTIGELRKGVAAKRVQDAAAADRLAEWVERLEAEFAERIIPVDRAIARIWGELSARRSLPVVDTLIAATALASDLTLVTRNVRDVAATGVNVINPWREG
jgi:toxin FitB